MLTRLCGGCLEPDNSRRENCLRGIALGRKNWTFAGSDKGGERAAAIYTLIEIAKLNRVDPEAWPCDVLTHVADGQSIIVPPRAVIHRCESVRDSQFG